jgi:hypothetical protein
VTTEGDWLGRVLGLAVLISVTVGVVQAADLVVRERSGPAAYPTFEVGPESARAFEAASTRQALETAAGDPCTASVAEAHERLRQAQLEELKETPTAVLEREARDPDWADPMETFIQERLERLARAHRDIELSTECRERCCVLRIGGPGAIALGEELMTAAGLPLVLPLNSRSVETDGGMEEHWLYCTERTEPYPPADFVDRLPERLELGARLEPLIAHCHGLAGSPGTLIVSVLVSADGSEIDIHTRGDIRGTEASACVEDAIQAASRFAPADRRSALELVFEIGASE